MKAQITLIELISVLIALFIALGILFPRFVYKNRWKEASVILLSRDLILAMDRIGSLYNYSFDELALNYFLNQTIREKILMPWTEVENTFPNKIVIACNCTQEEINKMNFWFSPLFINNRRIYFFFLSSKLEEIPPETDILLIKGYKNLENFNSLFKKYISRDIGIIELMNFDSEVDDTQGQIFGIECSGVVGIANYMNFSKPKKASDLIYLAYKNFYHVPLPLNSSLTLAFPDCQQEGKFVLNRSIYTFWICNESYVWFDVNGDGTRDRLVRLHEKVTIGNFNFTLSYIHEAEIALSFSNKPEYIFGNYLPSGKCNIFPNDGNNERILIKAIDISTSQEYPAVILNSSRVAWMYDFGNNPSDDEKNLLLSLILWASRKKSMVLPAIVQKGFSTSYINVENNDIFEVYKITLGLSYPY